MLGQSRAFLSCIRHLLSIGSQGNKLSWLFYFWRVEYCKIFSYINNLHLNTCNKFNTSVFSGVWTICTNINLKPLYTEILSLRMFYALLPCLVDFIILPPHVWSVMDFSVETCIFRSFFEWLKLFKVSSLYLSKTTEIFCGMILGIWKLQTLELANCLKSLKQSRKTNPWQAWIHHVGFVLQYRAL